MKLSDCSAPTWLEKALRTLTNGVGGVALLAGSAALTAGCLDRPVTPATPTTNNVYIDQIRQTGVDKIDLLFMIDNSISMADKQAILAEAVPVLVNRLIDPICVDDEGNPTGGSQPCTAPSSAEFKAIQDIHIGVITSSIGDHGSADVCAEATAAGTDSTYNDKAQLVPSIYNTLPNRATLTSWNNAGFLVWDPRTNAGGVMPHNPPGFSDGAAFIAEFRRHVQATGEHGCGYEAQLESWYRFLVDPEPVDSLTNDGATSVRGAVNPVVLAQRAAFLRPDSLLAIIMLTDENDCSIIDENGYQGWLVPFKGGPMVNSWRMPRAHAVCATAPNDPACGPCVMGDADPACAAGAYLPADDAPNVRCYRQKQRFGIDLLYPIQRYVDGLKSPLIYPRPDGVAVPNPIYTNNTMMGAPPRDSGLVFLAGIVGVPWQDIATEDTVNHPRDLRYMNADEIAEKGRWAWIVGDPYSGVNPSDPFMVESIDPRTDMMPPLPTLANPALPAAILQPAGGTGSNPINGREQTVIAAERADLQFACTFPLDTPVPCDATNDGGCDCNADEYGKNSPLCMYQTPNADGTQVNAKAYPGLRELQVLQGLGSNAIVASICPKNTTPMGGNPETDASYGYNPAVAAIVDRLKEALTAKCLPRPLIPEQNMLSPEFGKVPCAVIEVRPNTTGTCEACVPANGRTALTDPNEAKIIPAVIEFLSEEGYCAGGGENLCNSNCMCKLQQFTDVDLAQCVSAAADPGNLFGYCYVDPTVPGVNLDLLANCGDTEQRILRFLGANVPAKDGLAFIACIGDAAAPAAVMPAMP